MDPRLRGDDTIGAQMTGSGQAPQVLNANKEAKTLMAGVATSSDGCRTPRDIRRRNVIPAKAGI